MTIHNAVQEHQQVIASFFDQYENALQELASAIAACFAKGNKLLFCGNGGSASDALHVTAEFVGRFVDDRPALPAIALNADNAILTAVANDYGYDRIFARQVEALGHEGDLLIGISTSGSSPNVLAAFEQARKQKLTTVLLTGEKGKHQEDKVDHLFAVPSKVTARVQEVHIMFLHLLTELVEGEIAESKRQRAE